MSGKNGDRQAIRDLRTELRFERDRQMRMYSRTFWEGRLGIQRRSQARVESVSELLEEFHIDVSLDGMFGSEADTEWLVFTAVNVPSWPTDRWFEEMAAKQLKTESEVEAFFLHPLLRSLGYEENELSLSHRIVVSEGSSSTYYKADLVVFDGRTTDEALLVGEAKSPREALTSAHMNQGRSYAQWLNAPLYLITNFDTTHVYYNPPSICPKCILEFGRDELGVKWQDIIRYLDKESTVGLKCVIRKRLSDIV